MRVTVARGRSNEPVPHFCGSIIPRERGKPPPWPRISRVWEPIRWLCRSGARLPWAQDELSQPRGRRRKLQTNPSRNPNRNPSRDPSRTWKRHCRYCRRTLAPLRMDQRNLIRATRLLRVACLVDHRQAWNYMQGPHRPRPQMGRGPMRYFRADAPRQGTSRNKTEVASAAALCDPVCRRQVGGATLV